MDANIEKPKTPEQLFKERIVEKLRSDIGSLIPDEVLGNIVAAGVKEVFFEDRFIPQQYDSPKREESWFKQELRPVMEKSMRDEVAKWSEGHQDEIKKMVLCLIGETPEKLFSNMLTAVFTDLHNVMLATVQNELSKRQYR